MRYLMLCLTVLALLSACAGNPPASEAPKIARITPEELERLLPKPTPNLSLDEVIRMSKAGEAPEAIIATIRDSHSSYALTTSQMIELNRQGVDGKVLDHIQAAQEQAMRDAFADELNQRERVNQEKIKALQRELMWWPYYYDPFWGYPFRYDYPYGYPHPYWRR
jgi:hypothetical protein